MRLSYEEAIYSRKCVLYFAQKNCGNWKETDDFDEDLQISGSRSLDK